MSKNLKKHHERIQIEGFKMHKATVKMIKQDPNAFINCDFLEIPNIGAYIALYQHAFKTSNLPLADFYSLNNLKPCNA